MSSQTAEVQVQQWHNEAGRDNIITQTIFTTGSVWFLILISTFFIYTESKKWKESQKREATKRLEFLKEKLGPHMIENASYEDQGKRSCDPGTRKDILQEIISWISDVKMSKKSQCFYWLSGEPGVGKSAITASVVKHCIDNRILGAQFFINRDDTRTTDPCVLFPTICYQLCQRFPRVALAMENTLRNQPTLVVDISDEQAAKLFVKAIESAAEADQSQAVVVVIDALDETDMKRLRDLALILSKVVTELPRNAKVFISSRTEEAITKPFAPLRDHKQVQSRFLAAKDSKEEVATYMEKKFQEILTDNSMDWEDWKEDSRKLSSQASGLYIWAETALKLLRTEIEDKGTTCFGGLLDMLKTKGMNDINTLYLNVLQQRTCKDSGAWEYQRFRRIIGAILVRQTPLSITDMAQLLDLQDPQYSKPVDVVQFVRQYRTILVNDTKKIDGLVVPRTHKSFADFITSEWAREFRVDRSASHGELALRCMKQFSRLIAYLFWDNEQEVASMSFPTQLVYISQHWQTHLTRIVEPDLNNDTEEKNESDASDIPKGNDTEGRGVKDLKPDIEEVEGSLMGRSQPWSSLAFSHDGTQIASPLRECDIQVRDARTGSVTMVLTGHEDTIRSVGFSPDGTQFVSSSDDCTARIWDAQTWSQLHVLRGHTNGVLYAAFSHDRRTVVTCSDDKTVRTWDSRTGQTLNVFNGHTDSVRYCTFSPNDQRIASYSWNEIMVWDVNLGNLISEFEQKYCWMIAFCPCGDHLISHDRDEIKLWNAQSGDLNQLDHTNSTNAWLAFVKDSKRESASAYIEVPPAVSTHKTHIYSLKTELRDIEVWGIVEQGQGSTWGSMTPLHGNGFVHRLCFDVGTTRIN